MLHLSTLTTHKRGTCVFKLVFPYCRLEYIQLGSPHNPVWTDFPLALMQTRWARHYVTLFESPIADSELSDREEDAVRASSLLAVPPPPPEVQALEGLKGVILHGANLTEWASWVQDVASHMRHPPVTATHCPVEHIAGILHRLENLTKVCFCRLFYALNNSCSCARMASQTPRSYRDLPLWFPPPPTYASMASSGTTTTSTSLGGVSSLSGPQPGFPLIEMPALTDMLSTPPGYNPLKQAGVGRGNWPQLTVGSRRPPTPGITRIRQVRPSSSRQPASASGSGEAAPATPYRQQVQPPPRPPPRDKRLRFTQQVAETKTVASTTTTQGAATSAATRGRPQTRGREDQQRVNSRSRARRDRSSTRGPRRGVYSKDPMDDLMNFIPSSWKGDLEHMVGCFYASQIRPLNTPGWEEDFCKFLRLMEECKEGEWLDIKELTPLHYMLYVARCFEEATGHHLSGLSKHTRWIRAKGYYHWKVSELKQLILCPHLKGLPVPDGPMTHPSVSEPQQKASLKSSKAGATVDARHDRTKKKPTSGSPGGLSEQMEIGGSGDNRSWHDRVVARDATMKNGQKRRRTDTDQPTQPHPFPLESGPIRKEAMGAIYDHVKDLEPPQKDIPS